MTAQVSIPEAQNFEEAFATFQELVETASGTAFRSFQEGLPNTWESYKIALREHALFLMQADQWKQDDIGSGRVLEGVIAAIEIGDNNLVQWRNRWGHANRQHHVLLDARHDPALRDELEQLLFRLYRRDAAEDWKIFDRLAELVGWKYPLVAYLFFLRDMEHYAPVHPTGFDRAFAMLGIEFHTSGNCNWSNYAAFNTILNDLRQPISKAASLSNVRLIDAHSFCWMLYSLTRKKESGDFNLPDGEASKEYGRSLLGFEKSIAMMRYSIESAVRQSGKTVQQQMKDKQLWINGDKIEEILAAKLMLQGNRCALTGIPLHSPDMPGADPSRFPSADRKDSDGHYEEANLQIVCRFINMWKGTASDEEFKRLLMLVRTGGEEEE